MSTFIRSLMLLANLGRTSEVQSDMSALSLQDQVHEASMPSHGAQIVSPFTPSAFKYKIKTDLYRKQRNQEKADKNAQKYDMLNKIDLRLIHDHYREVEAKVATFPSEIQALKEKLVKIRKKYRVWEALALHYAEKYPYTHIEGFKPSQPMRKEVVTRQEYLDYLKQHQYMNDPEEIEWDQNAREAAKAVRVQRDYFSPMPRVTSLRLTNAALLNGTIPADEKTRKRMMRDQAAIQAIAKQDSQAAEFIASGYRQSYAEKKACLEMLKNKRNVAVARSRAWGEYYGNLEKVYGYPGHLEPRPELQSPLFSDESQIGDGDRTESEHFGSGSDNTLSDY